MSILCVCIPNLSILWNFIYLPIMLILSLVLWGFTVPRTLEQSQLAPQIVSRRRIIVWSFVYLMPQILLEYTYWKLSFMFMIPV